MTDFEARIQAIEDHIAITQLRSRYCHFLDDRDWLSLANLFTDDGEFEGLAYVKGRDNILPFFRDTIAIAFDGFWHFCSNPTVDLHGASATGRISMEYLSVKEGVSFVSAGHYEDRMVKDGSTWRFRSRKITFYFLSPLSDGFIGQPTFMDPLGNPLRRETH